MRYAFFAALVIGSTTFATIASAGDIIQNKISSRFLKRDMNYNVYLPDAYRSGTQKFAVLYLLHGAGGDENAWLKLGKIKTTADRLIAQKAIPPTIILMPGCRRCWWVDGARDQAESALWQELIPAVERTYRVTAGRAGRFFAGNSAGGHAVVRYAMKYPEKIAAAAALSPAIYADLPPPFSSARQQPPFLDGRDKFSATAWRSQNYPSFMAGYVAQQVRVPMYLMSGDKDRYGIANETAYFFKQLFENQPNEVEFHVIDGGHSWRVWSKAIAGAMIFMLNRPANAKLVRER